MSAAPDNQRSSDQQEESALPLALLIHEDGEDDTFLATIDVQGDTLVFELDDGRTIALDRKELLHRAA